MSRTRNYATVIYPESMGDYNEFIEKLTQTHIPMILSPLHNQDINPTGEHKKEHFHLMIMYDSVKTYNQAQDLIDIIGGVGCEVINSIRGYARYLCHLDNPEKAQYNIENIIELNGANYYDIINLASDKYAMIDEMTNFIDEYEILSFAEFYRFCRDYRKQTWYKIITDNSTYVIKEYLKSKKWEKETTYKSRLCELEEKLIEEIE